VLHGVQQRNDDERPSSGRRTPRSTVPRPRHDLVKGESAEKDAHTLDDALKKSATNTLRVKVDFNFLKKQK
jgi:hypothetical protein